MGGIGDRGERVGVSAFVFDVSCRELSVRSDAVSVSALQ